jgi:hypothetical protein
MARDGAADAAAPAVRADLCGLQPVVAFQLALG